MGMLISLSSLFHSVYQIIEVYTLNIYNFKLSIIPQ